MATASALSRLADIVEVIDLVEAELKDVTLAAFATYRRKRWVVERDIEIISEASRRLPDSLKQRHAAIPWRKVTATGNVIRHEYEIVAHDILRRIVREDFVPPAHACRVELRQPQTENDSP